MQPPFVDIHTHRPTGRHIELRTAGIHPWEADRRSAASLRPLPEGVQAIGETGLDYVRGASRERQSALFREQLALARESGLPVVIHCVKAFEPVMKELAACTPRAVLFHGFIGSPEQARQAVGRGYYLSFGMRSFASPRSVEALRATPLAQLFLETDEGETPIETVYAQAAALRGTTVDALRQALSENYRRLFTEPKNDANHE